MTPTSAKISLKKCPFKKIPIFYRKCTHMISHVFFHFAKAKLTIGKISKDDGKLIWKLLFFTVSLLNVHA